MPLRRLTGLEHDKLKDEEAELTSKVADLTGLLSDKSRVVATVTAEAKELRDAYGIDRRTVIDTSAAAAAAAGGGGGGLKGDDGEAMPLGDMDESERAVAAARLYAKRHNVTLDSLNAESLVIMTGRGYIKRIDPSVFSKQNKNTRGRNMGKMRGGDEVTKVRSLTSGTSYWLKARTPLYNSQSYVSNPQPRSSHAAGGALPRAGHRAVLHRPRAGVRCARVRHPRE
jgi:DNA gyrase subunit A